MKNELSYEQIEETLDVLMNDIVYASMLNRLIQGIYECIIEDERVYKRTATFWTIAFESLKEARLIRLCRLVDKTNKSISLINALRMLKANREKFDKEKYEKIFRDKNGALGEHNKYIELENDEIDDDIKSIEDNHTTSKIRIWRNNYMAHKGFDVAILKAKPGQIEMDVAEIGDYLLTCKDLINKYASRLFSKNWTEAMFTEDFRNVFKLCKKGIESYDAEIDAVLNKITKAST